MLLGEKQKVIRLKNSEQSFQDSRLKFHMLAIMKLLKVTLVGDEFIHWCSGITCCKRGHPEFKEKLAYHFVCLMEGGVPKFMPTRFTKIFGTPCYVSILQCLGFYGATAFQVAFKKNAEEAIETIKNAKDIKDDPLADINWV